MVFVHAARRNGISALAAAALVAVVGMPTRVHAQPTRPNVIVIVSDDFGYAETGFSAALVNRTTQFRTPNLDALAQQSVVMRQGYASGPLCGPSRAGLLTGQYQQRIGNEENLPNDINSPFGLSGSETLISDRFKALGYSTGAIGKWHEGYTAGVNRPLDSGFDEFFGFLSGGRQYYTDIAPSNVMYRNNTNVEFLWRSEGDHSLYDPVKGRYSTDAFGEEGASFVNRHANDANPFFLYMAPNAAHTPYAYKQSDYDLFSNITDATQRQQAAMTYAFDRAVGTTLSAVTAKGLDNNTIVVFVNDNGGTSINDNLPYRGFKGYTWEGGIRVPYLIKAPGLAPGTYNSPVTFYDLVPTLIGAAGATVAPEDTAGVDLMPYLSGQQAGAPHDELYWRNFTFWAVRKGDWKLCRPNEAQFNFYALYNLATDPGEQTNLINTQTAKRDELYRDFTLWEATLTKPKWGVLGVDDRNKFDHFVFRNDLATSSNWGASNTWYQAGTSTAKTMLPDDAYANGIFEFGTRNDASYTASNNVSRLSGLTFMLNQLRLTGNFTGTGAQAATLNGNPLLFVKSLSGGAPQIQLTATSGGAQTFGFNLNNQLQLLDDLQITGDGTQNFTINGVFQDYYLPRGITKLGSSQVTLTGASTFTGDLIVSQGGMTVSGATATINGAAHVRLDAPGTLALAGGLIRTGQFDASAGGTFQFQSGTLNLTGAGSQFGPNRLDVGTAGVAFLTLNPAATATTAGLRLGDAADGRLTLGAGSTLTTFGDAVEAFANSNTAGGSQATIDGGTWNINGGLTVGNLGNATLTLRNGGAVNVQGITSLAAASGSNAAVSVGGAGVGAGSLSSLIMNVGGTGGAGGGTASLTIGAGGVVAAPGDFRIGDAGTVNLQGGQLQVGNFEKAASGVFNWQSGTLAFTGPQGGDIGPGGPLGAAVTLASGKTLAATAALRVTSGGSLSVGSGAISTAVLEVDGGVFTASSLAGVGALHFNSGTVNLTGGGVTTVGPGGLTGGGGAIVIGPGGELGASVVLNPGDAFHDSGTTLLPFGGSLTVNGGVFTTNILELDGGKFTGPNLTGIGSLVFNSGTLGFTGDFNVVAGGPLGANVTLVGGQTIETGANLSIGVGANPGTLVINAGGEARATVATAIASGGSLTLNGGKLTTGSLVKTAGGTFNWQAGTLRFSDDLQIQAAGDLGANLTVGASKTLEVADSLRVGTDVAAGALVIGSGGVVKALGSTTIDALGSVTLSGGKLSTASLTRVAGSTFDWQSGTLEFTGNLAIGPGADLGGSVALGSGRTLRTLGGLSIGNGANAGTLSIATGAAVETVGSTTVDALGVVTLSGGTFTTGSLYVAPGGTFNWQSGAVAITGGSGLAVDATGPLGAGLVIGAGKSLSVTNDVALNSGGSIQVTDGTFAAGSVSLNGGQFAAPSLTGISHVNFYSGSLSVTGAGGATLADSAPLGANLYLDAGKTFAVTATTTVGAGSSLTVEGGAFSTGSLAVAGGVFTAADFTGVGSVDFTAGTITVTGAGGATIGGGSPLGSNVALNAGKTLNISHATTVATGASLSVNGGAFSTANLILSGGSYSAADLSGLGGLAFNSGSLSVTGAGGLSINGSSLLGPSVTLDSQKALQVTATTTLGNGGALAVSGGQFTTGALAIEGGSYTAADLTGAGSVSWNAGTVHLTGPAGATIGSGQPLGGNVVIDGSKTLTVDGTTSLASGGALTVAGGTYSTGTLAISGGTYAAPNLSGIGSVAFTSGAIRFTGDYAIAGGGELQSALGGQLQIGAGRRVIVDGVATLNAPMSIGGGRLSVGSFADPALLNFDAGTLDLTATNVAFAAGGMFGASYTVGSGKQLNVTQQVSVAPGSIVMIENSAGLGAGALHNSGEIVLEGLAAGVDAGSFTNSGALRGTGRVSGAVVNDAAGEVIANQGDRLRFLGPSFDNVGRISALGVGANPAEVEIDGQFTNAAGSGHVTGSNARFRLLGGAANAGSFSLTGGDNHVFGDLANAATGEILVTGGAAATFYDDVVNDGMLRVSKMGTTVSQAVFLGDVTGSGGSTGGGTIFFEGDLRPGNSPAAVSYGNDIFFGSNARVMMEIAGVTPGTGYDQINVTGTLVLGGKMELSLLNGFNPTAGSTYNLLTATGGVTGTFSSITLPQLSSGLSWQISVGSNSVVATVLSALPSSGDFNGDGFVDGADLLAWQRGLGATSGATRAQGDANNDGAVNAADLAVWKSQFGTSQAAAAVGVVPEPGGFALAAAAVVLGLAVLRHSRG